GHVGVDQDAHRQAQRPAATQLLTEGNGHPDVTVAAAVLLRVADAEKSQLAHTFVERLGKQPVVLPLIDIGGYFFVDETPHLLAESLVFLREKARWSSHRTQLVPS